MQLFVALYSLLLIQMSTNCNVVTGEWARAVMCGNIGLHEVRGLQMLLLLPTPKSVCYISNNTYSASFSRFCPIWRWQPCCELLPHFQTSPLLEVQTVIWHLPVSELQLIKTTHEQTWQSNVVFSSLPCAILQNKHLSSSAIVDKQK